MTEHTHNQILSPYRAIVRGQETGLAACVATGCARAAHCLRAEMAERHPGESAAHGVDFTPRARGCRMYIARGAA